jgi:NADH-quinone oxidoreductase subunit A
MFNHYLPVLLQVVVALGFSACALVFSVLFGRAAKRNPTKDTPYECGIRSERVAHPRFSVKFYLVAMLFILFDLELVFMYPWAVVYTDLIATHGPAIFWSMLSFVGVVTVGYVYAITKGVLNWQH